MTINKCCICAKVIVESLDGRAITYTSEDGVKISVPYDSTISILWPRTNGQLWVCEQCYPEAVAARFQGIDLAEVHYFFGLEYQEKKLFDLAKMCFIRALAIEKKAAYLAALATLPGERLEKIRLNREALSLDSNCIVASLNLANLLDSV